MVQRALILFLIWLLSFALPAQNLDSLKQELKTSPHDTVTIKLLNDIGEIQPIYRISYWDSIKVICEKNLSKSDKKTKNFCRKYLSYALNNLGFLYSGEGDVKSSFENFDKCLKIFIETKDKEGEATVYDNMGNLYSDQGDIPKALHYYHSSLKIREEIKDKNGIGYSLNNIGTVYSHQGNHKQAFDYFFKSLKVREEIGDMLGMAESYNNIGYTYGELGDFLESMKFHKMSLEIREEINDKGGIALSLNNIGHVYYEKGDPEITSSKEESMKSGVEKSLEYYQRSLKLYEEVNDKGSLAAVLTNISASKLYQNKLSEALIFGERSLKIAKELGFPLYIKLSSETLSKIYSRMSNWKMAYDMQVLFKQMNDSISNENNKKASMQREFQYKYEKKAAADSVSYQKEKKVKEAELMAHKVEIQAKKNQQIAMLIGLVLIAIFTGVLFNRFKITQKQKSIIEKQKHIVEEKHKEITDSINYAERIQRSFMATKELLDVNLFEYFVLFNPKDVVSGDFYWASALQNGNFLLTTADSTGHGVPGAIMSILNISSLEKAVEQGLTNPAEILNHTRKTIIERLKKDGSKEGGKDGMDCSLMVFDFEKMKLHVAAANNPVWVIRKPDTEALEVSERINEAKESNAAVLREPQYPLAVIEIKPDKMPVGKHDKQDVSFTTHEVDLQKGDVVYSLTDGFPDQFGGEKGKKFMIKNLRELIQVNAHLPMQQQKILLEKIFSDWVGELEQIDDVCIVGVRV